LLQNPQRRLFVKASLVTLASLYIPRQAWASHADSLSGSCHAGPLALFNTHTKERLVVNLRCKDGQYDPTALDEINWLLRCHYANEVKPFDTNALEFLANVNASLNNSEDIQIISGYRSPAYNKMLRSHSKQVAKHSLHMQARAIDIRIPGVPLRKLRRVALNLNQGGVGYYPHSQFVHIDSGPIRTWQGS